MKQVTSWRTSHVFMAVLALAICLACNGKRDNPNPGGDIVGTWELIAFTYDGYFEAFDEAIPARAKSRELDNVLVTFHSDGTVTGTGARFVVAWISKADNKEMLQFDGELFEDGGTWQRNGNTLAVVDFTDGEEERIDLTITELTASQLHLIANIEVLANPDLITRMDMRFARGN